MDLLDELEIMARSATLSSSETPPFHDTIQRWCRLFDYTEHEARQKIEQHRADLFRETVSDAHWEMVRLQQNHHDKESYEHSLSLARGHAITKPSPKSSELGSSSTYLYKLQEPFASIDELASAVNVERSRLQMMSATYEADGKSVTFCKIDGQAKKAIESYLREHQAGCQATFVRYSKANKALSATSHYPTLGIDTTLPQYRPSAMQSRPFQPSQNEYPVWYFFYGTLGNKETLARLLGLEYPEFHAAKITGGALGFWATKYYALKDDVNGMVHGKAFLVQDKDQEDVLCLYETDEYEVVRCHIEMEDGETVEGLTFRFVEKRATGVRGRGYLHDHGT